MSQGKNKDAQTGKPLIPSIKKRDGSVVEFDLEKIKQAIFKSMKASGEGDWSEAEKVAKATKAALVKEARKSKEKPYTPSVEKIQDVVEQQLILENLAATAKAYIIYRERRAELRQEKGEIPKKVKELAEESKKYFRNPMSEFIFYRTYSRWIEEESRRETWIETVDRYIDFMRENLGDKLSSDEYREVREAILNQEIMPSMRLMQVAGPAARRTNVCAYNCSYIAPTKLRDFGEIMYLSMCGVGVGFSVESHTAQQLPMIKKQTGEKLPTRVIEDSKEGWSESLVFGLKTWYNGQDVDFDYSRLRPAGARLKTMGGKSSGPEPLRELMNYARERILRLQNRRLSNLDVHDIICKIGEVVVSGGVRRSALISLSDLDDHDVRHAKDGQFYLTHPERAMSNNSAVYNYKPTGTEFLDEWLSLMKGGSGERGIFNRGGLKSQLPERRWATFSPGHDSSGINPCGEVILKSKQFCNLSEVVARHEDTEESLLRKIRLATLLGNYQSSLTNFGYLSSDWKKNCEAERLLGVSITGQWDCPKVWDAKMLEKMRSEAIAVNEKYAKKFGINPSAAITCVKPSGTVSQLVDASSGMHPRHSEYYIRRIRIAASDSLFKMLKDQGVPYKPEVGQADGQAITYVLEFPVKAPGGSTHRDDLSAIEQLEHWKKVKESYTEHNPSVTISVSEDEWVQVANWVYENWEIIGGLSFLPRLTHVYKLAPYEEITKEEYEEMKRNFVDIDFSKIVAYEVTDQTEGTRELACSSGLCEIDDLVGQDKTES